MMNDSDRQFHLHPMLLLAIIALAGIIAMPKPDPVEARTADEGTPQLYAGAGALLDPRSSAGELTDSTAQGGVVFEAIPEPVTATAPVEEQTSADPVSDDEENADKTAAEEAPVQEEKTEDDSAFSQLVMADVNEVMNVRTEPDASSEKIGVLYKDCGGTILERQNGWTKLKSGSLVGWANDDYLLFGSDAEKLARDVGVLQATATTDTLRVRKQPSTDSNVLGLVAAGDSFEVLEEESGSGFVLIDYKGKEGYLSSDYVKVEFKVDSGETLAAIAAREKAEKERKAKLTANRGAIKTSEDEVRLLAALIYCESGNQPYEGQLGVGAVVMNRVRSAAYPNTIVDVIYASGQFTPAATGHVANAYNGNIPASCIQAAQAAINGETTVGGACHFRRAGAHEGTVIGGHVFW